MWWEVYRGACWGPNTEFIPLIVLSGSHVGPVVRLAIKRHQSKYICGMSLLKPRRHSDRHVAGGQAVDR